MPQDLWILDDEPIEISFDAKGFSFFKAMRGVVSDPIQADLRLVAVKEHEKIEIERVTDLAGRVVIKSPDEALEFVRLFTSPATHYLFADSQYLEVREAGNGPRVGEYSKEYGELMNLEPPVASGDGDLFVIERTLLDRSDRLLRAREQVTRDGRYELSTAVVIDERPPVSYPIYQ